jgi:hypothetical protein
MSRFDKLKEVILILEGVRYANPMPVRDISELLGIKDGMTCPKTRRLILTAMKTYNTPIGSDNRGYYTIRTAHEMQRYLNSLLQRQIGITNRIDTVYKAFHGRN